MEIQLTKSKTITIGGGPKKREAGPSTHDLVGIDLFSGDPRGCPAVRLSLKKGVLHLVAAGFVPPPADALPDSWESAAKKCLWSLPADYQAPTAAFAVSSPDAFFAQSTLDAFRADLAAGGHREETKAPRAKRFGIARPAEKPAEPPPASAQPPPEATSGVPLSHGGTRFVMRPIPATEGFVLEAGLPEYQLLWLSRLLPEGRRPTASSVQPRLAARTASLLHSSAFADAGGSALAVFVDDDAIQIAGYREKTLVLWRTCSACGGWTEIRRRVKDGLGLEDNMVESVLNDTLIDPTPVLEPALEPILQELTVSRDYLVGKLDTAPKSVFILGLKAGFGYWKTLLQTRLGIDLIEPQVFAGLEIDAKAKDDAAFAGSAGHVFLGALGAALARLDDDRTAGHGELHLNLLAESECVSSSPVRLRVMLPVLAMLAGVGMVVWWGILFARLLMVTTQSNSLKDDLAHNEKAHKQILAQLGDVRERETELEQLEGYRQSRQTWGQALSAVAEVMPLKVQLTRLEIPAPPPQVLAPPGWRGPIPWGPTNTTEDVSLILSGRTPKETPVISLMESLEAESFTNILTIVKDPQSPVQSPRVRSFRQDTTARGDSTRLLSFEIEYRARARRFTP